VIHLLAEQLREEEEEEEEQDERGTCVSGSLPRAENNIC